VLPQLFTVAFESLLISLLSKAERVEESNGSNVSRKVSNSEGVHGGGCLAHGSGGEGGRARKREAIASFTIEVLFWRGNSCEGICGQTTIGFHALIL